MSVMGVSTPCSYNSGGCVHYICVSDGGCVHSSYNTCVSVMVGVSTPCSYNSGGCVHSSYNTYVSVVGVYIYTHYMCVLITTCYIDEVI